MEPTFERLVEAIGRDGPRRFARWDPQRFLEVREGPARQVWEALRGDVLAARVFEGYLRLVEEAIGLGYLGKRGDGPPTWIGHCLAELVPKDLARIPSGDRLPTLARVWNLGEGLLREPEWVDRYVVSCARDLEGLEGLEAFLVRVLEPALSATSRASWDGPFALEVLDPRPAAEAFLPGEMYLAAPSVLCVRDRRDPEVQLGVFLRREGGSRLMGAVPPLPRFPDGENLPPVVLSAHRASIGGKKVALPYLRQFHRSLLAETGFLVVSAVDSQRLWIVESP